MIKTLRPAVLAAPSAGNCVPRAVRCVPRTSVLSLEVLTFDHHGEALTVSPEILSLGVPLSLHLPIFPGGTSAAAVYRRSKERGRWGGEQRVRTQDVEGRAGRTHAPAPPLGSQAL